MNSSNSFKTIEALHRERPLFTQHPESFQSYLAHTHSKKPHETLVEHTDLVVEFMLRLVKVHQLDAVIDRLLQLVLQQAFIDEPQEIGNRIKRLFLNALIYHDTGKINENFQVERMKNPVFKSNPENGIETKHSILSAYVYISNHFAELLRDENLSEEIKGFLLVFVLIFATPILKHHASYVEKEYPVFSELLFKLAPYLKKFEIEIDSDFLQGIFDDPDAVLKQNLDLFPKETRFPIYLLLKLCYSLLTASDYYATSSFMLNLPIEDFGVISAEQRDRFDQNLLTTKNYNQDFFENRDYFRNYPKQNLMECNPDNLNLLRKKMLDEVLCEVEENPLENIFYLEAPTGSGKTNTSMAVAIELLKSNPEINKIYYVFPFTTLITQTAKSISETLGATSEEMIQLHSRSGFSQKREENEDDSLNLNYIDHLFLNYPITLLTHVKFFDILKSNRKDVNYLVHRLANSIVIIDELQSYPPREWDKIAYFIHQYAKYFNIKFVVMSATLPKLDNLNVLQYPLKFHQLLKDKDFYFTNPNFKSRVNFDFSLLESKPDLEQLAEFVIEQSNSHAETHSGKAKTIIEFIYKKTASDFLRIVSESQGLTGYKIYLLSGTILEPRRREIIDDIKASLKRKDAEKILLISTQVVEAGVDIDMDIGFKDQSLVDSDEQLAGRVNRNARPEPGKVFIFNLDSAQKIYGNDLRYRISKDSISKSEYQTILETKDFDIIYSKVCQKINKENSDEFVRGFDDYKSNFKTLKMRKIHEEFKIIDQQNITIFVPLDIPGTAFSVEDQKFLSLLKAIENDKLVSGERIWQIYLELLKSENPDYIKKQIDLKKINGIMAQFMFSTHIHSKIFYDLKRFCDPDGFEDLKIFYLSEWKKVYDYNSGIKDDQFDAPAFY